MHKYSGKLQNKLDVFQAFVQKKQKNILKTLIF